MKLATKIVKFMAPGPGIQAHGAANVAMNHCPLGPVIVAFVGNLCLRPHILTYIQTIDYYSFSK